MSDDALVEKLIKRRDACTRGIWPWLCFCPACARAIVLMYRSGQWYDLPPSVRREVEAAEEKGS